MIYKQLFKNVGLPGLEPGKAGPESAVLPLHHSPMLRMSRRTFAAAKLQLFYELTNLYAKKITIILNS